MRNRGKTSKNCLCALFTIFKGTTKGELNALVKKSPNFKKEKPKRFYTAWNLIDQSFIFFKAFAIPIDFISLTLFLLIIPSFELDCRPNYWENYINRNWGYNWFIKILFMEDIDKSPKVLNG